jgi:hypothetical protein
MAAGNILAFLLLILAISLIIGFAFLGKRWPVVLRRLQGYEDLGIAIERAVEAGERIHLSLGTGSVAGSESAPALVGLAVLSRIAASTILSDKPVIVSSGDGAMAILAQDTLHSSCRLHGSESDYEPTNARMVGPTPFAYAAGMPSLILQEEVSVHILSGSFGIEAGLASDFGKRGQAFVLAGTDDIQSQALLYTTADAPMIGEELFASGAYLEVNDFHRASLRAQDVLRLILVALIILGTLLRTFGVFR